MKQLTIPLYEQIEAAIHTPQAADLLQLLAEFDAIVVRAESEGFDDQALLDLAGETIAKIAVVFEAKYGTVLEEVRASGAGDGPVMPIDAFSQYVRSSMQIDFSQYIEPIPMLNLPVQPDDFYGGWSNLSAYWEVETALVESASSKVVPLSTIEEWQQLLQNLGEVEEAELKQIKELSHGEEIEAWSAELRAIVEKLRKRRRKSLPFLDLVYALMRKKNQPLKGCSSELWLAFLLGEHPYQLHRTAGDFYSVTGIEVLVRERGRLSVELEAMSQQHCV